MIQREYDDPEPAIFTAVEIQFNGRGKDGHETFFISRVMAMTSDDKPDEIFAFCKTAQKPYDELVTAILLAFQYQFPDTKVSSDGGWSDWEPGRALYARTFPDRPAPVCPWPDETEE